MSRYEGIPFNKSYLLFNSHVSSSFLWWHWDHLLYYKRHFLREKNLAGLRLPLLHITSASLLVPLLQAFLVNTTWDTLAWLLVFYLVLLERLHYLFQECATSD